MLARPRNAPPWVLRSASPASYCRVRGASRTAQYQVAHKVITSLPARRALQTCENTIGSYNCVCSGDYFGTRNAGQGKCGGLLSTADCCGESGECKADFVCHTDHCSGNKCHKDGYCIPGNSPNEYACACNDDYVGDGFDCEFVNYCKVRGVGSVAAAETAARGAWVPVPTHPPTYAHSHADA